MQGDFLVEGRPLDQQQLDCVMNLYHNHLVVAGAGTGKTTTIIGKLRYLISTGKFQPEDILVLSFTNASAKEMSERIQKETKCQIAASTFHKLGLEIIKTVNPKVKITKTDLTEFVQSQIDVEEIYLADKIVQVINLARAANIDLQKILAQKKWKTEDQKILEASIKFSKDYATELRRKNEIDFSDMIILATDFIKTGKYRNPYKFVIVDEYQDISPVRYELLKALRESADYDLFCVGDDWQAIYRFAGSEVDLILNFEKYWGKTQLSKIETTYRFPKTLAAASGKFVMENFRQIRKNVKARADESGYAITEICADTNAEALQHAKDILRELPENSSVFFLGRYTRDSACLGNLQQFLPSRPDLTMAFLTMHKSKGLQADYVFVLNMKNGKMGFPSQKENPALIKALGGKAEKFPNAEERRLFYVALTRAKKKAYLLTCHGHKSDFILELEDLLFKKMPIMNFGLLEDEDA